MDDLIKRGASNKVWFGVQILQCITINEYNSLKRNQKMWPLIQLEQDETIIIILVLLDVTFVNCKISSSGFLIRHIIYSSRLPDFKPQRGQYNGIVASSNSSNKCSSLSKRTAAVAQYYRVSHTLEIGSAIMCYDFLHIFHCNKNRLW